MKKNIKIKKFQEFITEYLKIKQDFSIELEQIPGEITEKEFKEHFGSVTRFEDHELLELNILFGDLEGRVGMWEPDKEFIKYEFKKEFGGFGTEQILFKGYIVKQEESENFLVNSTIRYRYGDYVIKKPVYLSYKKISDFARVYKNLPDTLTVQFVEKF
jgi:hypothetical protein